MSCSICLESCKNPFTSSKCEHTFCNTCILEWMLQHDTCPLCRSNIAEPSNINSVPQEESMEKYFVIIIGNYYENEINMLASILSDYVNSWENTPYYKWKDNSYGTSHTTIRKSNMYIDFKLEMYSIEGTTDHNIKIYINRRNIIKYKKKRDNYSNQKRFIFANN